MTLYCHTFALWYIPARGKYLYVWALVLLLEQKPFPACLAFVALLIFNRYDHILNQKPFKIIRLLCYFLFCLFACFHLLWSKVHYSKDNSVVEDASTLEAGALKKLVTFCLQKGNREGKKICSSSGFLCFCLPICFFVAFFFCWSVLCLTLLDIIIFYVFRIT